MTTEYSESPHVRDTQTPVSTEPPSQKVPETVGQLQEVDVTPEQTITGVTTECE